MNIRPHTPHLRSRRFSFSFFAGTLLWVAVLALGSFALEGNRWLAPAQAADSELSFAAPTPTPICAGAECDQLLPPIVADSLNNDILPQDGYAVCQVDPGVTTALDMPRMPFTPCVGGTAGGYACNNVDLQAFLPLNQIGGGGSNLGSSLWGWTDPVTEREYALFGLRNRTSFVDITDPVNPFYIGYLASHTGSSSWRELKTYNNHAFIVSDSNGNHGVQIFDLTLLRNYQTPPGSPIVFSETAHYGNAGSIHNIWVNEETGYAYAVGTASGTTTCSRGVHIFNVQNPTSPTFTACYPATTTAGYYTHDIDCMIYDGPDADYQGHEICIASDGKSSGSNDSMAILDVTNKNAIVEVARVSYLNDGFIHQTDFTEDMNYLVLDDELDETGSGFNRRTHIFNMQDLDNPLYVGFHQAGTAIDHNQYVKGDYLYQANYTEGIAVFTMENIASGSLTPYGFFDVYTASNAATFNGVWNVYPYFDSGNIIAGSIEQGLFILRPNLPQLTPTPSATNTATATNTPVPTNTPTNTPVPTHTSTHTATATASNTPIPPTFTPTTTATATRTPTATATNTPISPTNTPTQTVIASATFTPNATFTATSTRTPSPTITVTVTRTPTYTPTPTHTATRTPSPTVTATGSLPPTFTATPTVTATPTGSNTPLPTNTPTVTKPVPPTTTPTATKGVPPTLTATATKGIPPTNTPTRTPKVPLPTNTPTATETPPPPKLYLPLVWKGK
jgi:choice-of-anchor B domain-containing protein